MQRRTVSRITGQASLLAIVCGGVTTNCDDCSDVDTTGRPAPQVEAPGTTVDLAGCESKRPLGSLNAPEQCLGMNMGGEELKPVPQNLTRCPDGTLTGPNDRLQVYWTLCNTAAMAPPVLLPYSFVLHRLEGGVEDPTPVFSRDFVQRELVPCDCESEVVVFNSPGDPGAEQLAPGAYVARLTGIYGSMQVNQVSHENIVVVE